MPLLIALLLLCQVDFNQAVIREVRGIEAEQLGCSIRHSHQHCPTERPLDAHIIMAQYEAVNYTLTKALTVKKVTQCKVSCMEAGIGLCSFYQYNEWLNADNCQIFSHVGGIQKIQENSTLGILKGCCTGRDLIKDRKVHICQLQKSPTKVCRDGMQRMWESLRQLCRPPNYFFSQKVETRVGCFALCVRHALCLFIVWWRDKICYLYSHRTACTNGTIYRGMFKPTCCKIYKGLAPRPESKDEDCVKNDNQFSINYNGQVNISRQGFICLPWEASSEIAFESFSFPENQIADANNFCRNSNEDANGPWCLIDRNNTYDYCYIRECTNMTKGRNIIIGVVTGIFSIFLLIIVIGRIMHKLRERKQQKQFE